jgi:hypothetical protein
MDGDILSHINGSNLNLAGGNVTLNAGTSTITGKVAYTATVDSSSNGTAVVVAPGNNKAIILTGSILQTVHHRQSAFLIRTFLLEHQELQLVQVQTLLSLKLQRCF